jgi:hypothetical protein
MNKETNSTNTPRSLNDVFQRFGMLPSDGHDGTTDIFGDYVFKDKSEGRKLPPRDPYTGQFMKQDAQPNPQEYTGTATEIPPQTIGANFNPYGYPVRNPFATEANYSIANDVRKFIGEYKNFYFGRSTIDENDELYKAYTMILDMKVKEFALTVSSKIQNRAMFPVNNDVNLNSIIDITKYFVDDIIEISKAMDIVTRVDYKNMEDQDFVIESIKKHEHDVISLFTLRMQTFIV